MLMIAKSMRQLCFAELMHVYEEGNRENGKEQYPLLSREEQLICAQQDFYHYLNSVFFRQPDSFYALWFADDRMVSALRIEPYRDGLLLCALETAPDARNQGFASTLISEVQRYLSEKGSGRIYSHVSKQNHASLAVHQKCGFHIISDHAVYSDGSVLHSCFTMQYEY